MCSAPDQMGGNAVHVTKHLINFQSELHVFFKLKSCSTQFKVSSVPVCAGQEKQSTSDAHAATHIQSLSTDGPRRQLPFAVMFMWMLFGHSVNRLMEMVMVPRGAVHRIQVEIWSGTLRQKIFNIKIYFVFAGVLHTLNALASAIHFCPNASGETHVALTTDSFSHAWIRSRWRRPCRQTLYVRTYVWSSAFATFPAFDKCIPHFNLMNLLKNWEKCFFRRNFECHSTI